AKRLFTARERYTIVRRTYPFTDRRLIEFMLAVPPWLTRNPARSRLLMMDALGALLPQDVVRLKDSRCVPTERRRFRRNALPSLQTSPLLVVERGLVDEHILEQRVHDLRFGHGFLGNLRRIEYLECWLRRRSDAIKQLNQCADLQVAGSLRSSLAPQKVSA